MKPKKLRDIEKPKERCVGGDICECSECHLPEPKQLRVHFTLEHERQMINASNLIGGELKQAPKEEDNSRPEFKECFECAKKPGSPELCAQCLWVRDNYRRQPKQAEGWRERFETEFDVKWDQISMFEEKPWRICAFIEEEIAAAREEGKSSQALENNFEIKRIYMNGYRQALNDAQEAISAVYCPFSMYLEKEGFAWEKGKTDALQIIENLKNQKEA